MKDRELAIKQEQFSDLKKNNDIILGINVFLFLYFLSRFV